MSLLMFVQEDDRVAVVTDTLATTQDGEPHMFVSKCWPIPHMGVLVAATGSGPLLDQWVEYLRTRMIARDVVNLDLHAPEGLREVWAEIEAEHGEACGTGTIYHFGVDPETGQMLRFTYRSGSDFESERADEPGFGCRPPLESADIADFADLVQIAEAIRSEQESLPPDEAVWIGGDLVLTTLGPDGFTIRRMHRFPDWDSAWNGMCARATSDATLEA